MGAEDTGISKEVLKLCDEQLAIPLIGHIESLNVSAAAAVMLFEVVRQRIGPDELKGGNGVPPLRGAQRRGNPCGVTTLSADGRGI